MCAKRIGRVSISLRGKRFGGVPEQRITARKMERVKEGGGEGRKETLADKPLDFENLPHAHCDFILSSAVIN